MKKLVTLILISSLFSQAALADCPNAIRLKVGDTVKDCERVGLSVEYEAQVRKQLVEGDFNKQALEEQQKVIKLKDLRISESEGQADLWKTEALREREALDKERSRNDLKFWLGLGAGILLTVGAGWAIGQAAKR